MTLAQPLVRRTIQNFQTCTKRLDVEAANLEMACSGWREGSPSISEAIKSEPDFSEDEVNSLLFKFAASAKSTREAIKSLDAYREQVLSFKELLPAFDQPAQNLADAVGKVVQACCRTATYFDGRQ